MQCSKKGKRYNKLKYWRNSLKLKQSDMAALLGLFTSTYTQKENGNIKFSLEEAKEIRRIFNEKLGKSGKDEIRLDDIFLD